MNCHFYFFFSSTLQHDDGRFSKYFNKTLVDTQANGSDADSEGSDCELVPKESNTSEDKATATVIATSATATPITTATTATMETIADFNGNPNLEISKVTVVTNRNGLQQPMNGGGAGTEATSLPNSPLKKSTPIKRSRRPESSKFNRSVVNSKNCATYYFKHMDTDPDSAPTTDGWSSQDASDLYSEEEQWIYTNGNDEVDGVGGARTHHDELNENHISVNMAQLSMQVNCNESILIDAVNGNKTDQVFALVFLIAILV